jgi:hypothetical protein
MALSKAVLEMLATITDENDRKEMQAKFEKYETVIQGRFDGNLRQEDYDRKMNESKKTVETLEATAKKWQEWADRNVPKHENLLKSYEEEQKKRQAVEEEVAKLKASGGGSGGGNGNVTVDEQELLKKVNAEVEKRGYVSKADMEAIVKAEAVKLAEEKTKELTETTLPAWANFNAQVTDAQLQYRDEFGKHLDRKAFIKYINDEKIPDVPKAYERFVEADRAKIKEAKMREEIEKDVRSKLSIPGTGAVPTPELGAMQLMLDRNKGVKVPDMPAELGAAAAAAELRAEGKI